MREEEFDASIDSRSFGTRDAFDAETRILRWTRLGVELWGRTADDLSRQLLLPHPRIPAGFDLADLRNLQRHVHTMAAAAEDPRFSWLPRSDGTVWEARCEIVRRAIAYLEDR